MDRKLYAIRLGELLREADISLSELARRVGGARQSASGWAKADGTAPAPREETLSKIAKELRTWPPYLRGETDSRFPPAASDIPALREDIANAKAAMEAVRAAFDGILTRLDSIASASATGRKPAKPPRTPAAAVNRQSEKRVRGSGTPANHMAERQQDADGEDPPVKNASEA